MRVWFWRRKEKINPWSSFPEVFPSGGDSEVIPSMWVQRSPPQAGTSAAWWHREISSGELGSVGLSTCRLAIQESNQIGNYLIIPYINLELPGERQAVLWGGFLRRCKRLENSTISWKRHVELCFSKLAECTFFPLKLSSFKSIVWLTYALLLPNSSSVKVFPCFSNIWTPLDACFFQCTPCQRWTKCHTCKGQFCQCKSWGHTVFATGACQDASEGQLKPFGLVTCNPR